MTNTDHVHVQLELKVQNTHLMIIFNCASARERTHTHICMYARTPACTHAHRHALINFYAVPPGADRWSSIMGIMIFFLDQDVNVKKSVEFYVLVEDDCSINHWDDLWPS